MSGTAGSAATAPDSGAQGPEDDDDRGGGGGLPPFVERFRDYGEGRPWFFPAVIVAIIILLLLIIFLISQLGGSGSGGNPTPTPTTETVIQNRPPLRQPTEKSPAAVPTNPPPKPTETPKVGGDNTRGKSPSGGGTPEGLAPSDRAIRLAVMLPANDETGSIVLPVLASQPLVESSPDLSLTGVETSYA